MHRAILHTKTETLRTESYFTLRKANDEKKVKEWVESKRKQIKFRVRESKSLPFLVPETEAMEDRALDGRGAGDDKGCVTGGGRDGGVTGGGERDGGVTGKGRDRGVTGRGRDEKASWSPTVVDSGRLSSMKKIARMEARRILQE